jgi:hypothetical protein
MAVPDSNPVEEAVELLQDAYARLKSEMDSIEAALEKLGRPVTKPTFTVTIPIVGSSRSTVRQLVESLLEEAAVSWTAPEVLEELQSRNADLGNAADPINAIRAALVDLNKNGTARRIAYGRYVAKQWLDDPDSAWPLDAEPEGAPG